MDSTTVIVVHWCKLYGTFLCLFVILLISFPLSVVRLIEQYLKENNLLRTLTVLQVSHLLENKYCKSRILVCCAFVDMYHIFAE